MLSNTIRKWGKTSLWEDHWTSDESLSKKFPRLFSTSLNKNITVSEVVNRGWASLRFRRALVGVLGEQWASMRRLFRDITLSEEPDRLIWTLTNSGIFSV